MADYVTYYSNVTGFVLGCWPRTTSDNIATWASDGFIEVDGVHVVEPLGDATLRTDLALVLLTDPTGVDTEAPTGVLEVDDAGTPTDMDFRTDGGKDPDYPYPEA